MMRFDYALLTSLFLSVILLTGTVVSGFLIQEAFAQVLPTMDINDVTAFEGDAGNTNFVFTVSLSSPPLTPVSANFATVEITASSGSDYVQQNGIVSFAVGESAKTITIVVKGDTGIEPNEVFLVRLSNAMGANLPSANEDGTGTILNDDGIPRILINDVAVAEGNSGTSTAQFTISLTATHTLPVTVNYVTADDSATVSDNDYAMSSGLVTIPAGQLNTVASVVINGDTTFEPNEFFFVNLFAPVNAAFNDPQGRGTILNDDSADILPNAIDDFVTTNEDMSIATNVLANDISTGNAPFTISSTHGAKGTTTVNPDNTITYIPNPDQNGFDSYTYTITDADLDADTTTVSVTITSVNDIPVATDDDYMMAEGATLVVGPPGILANDSDPDGDPFGALLVDDVSNGTLLLETTGNFAYTPDPNFDGVDTFTYRAYDDFSESDIVTVTITVTPVNDIPSANSDDMATSEDTAVTITLTGSDLDGDSLTFSVVAGPTHGTLGPITTITPTSSITSYTPNPNYFGPDSFTFVANDGTADSSVATVSITVNPVNDSPIANADTASIMEDSLPVAIDVLANDVDVDLLDVKTLVSVTQGATGGVAISGNSVLYSPAPNFAGTDTFTYVMQDSAGAQSGATVTVFVGAENDAPIATNDIYSIDEDGILVVPGVLANDSDVDSPVLTATLVMTPSHGILTLNPDGSFTYAPNPNYFGSDSFTYQANDGSLNSNIATVSITVNPLNDDPTAGDDSTTVLEDSSPTPIVVLTNDADIDGDNLTIVSVTDPANGIASTDGTTISYAPDLDYFGSDQFAYTISDGNGGFVTATVSVIVTPVNDLPTAGDDALITNEDTAETINVLVNDTDEEGSMTISSVDTPSHGTAMLSSPDSITYTPDLDYFGSDSFTYTIVDSEGAPATATVSVTILSVNDVPTAMPDAYSTDEDQALVVAIPGVLGNDLDVETTTLTAILVDNTLHGTLALSTDGSFTYTPNPNYFGSDSFTYRASDGEDTSNTTTVTITINSINDLPVAADDTATTQHNTPVTIPVLDNDSDIEGVLSILSVASPTSGTASVNSDNTITYLPSPGFFGTDSFLYTITDGVDADSATITITVTESATLFCGLPESSYNIIDGSSGNDNLSGTNGADLIRGYGGDDKIKGKNGNDCLIGGDGADKIWGGDGNDTMYGDAGADKLYGDKGDDIIYGGDGNDRLWGGKDDDDLYGEIGYDKIQGGDGNDSLDGGDQNDKIFGGKGNDAIDAGDGNDEVHANQGDDTISGGPGNDWLGAGKGNDVINAGDGNDKLFGRDGNDTLNGQGHDDQIHGGPGNDTMDGGETPNPVTDNDRCLGGPGTNSIVNCEVTRGGSDDSEEHRHDDYEGENEEPES
ncbi:Ig-like domain-containing protein [Candidatus Nitrosotenuis aquarius]|uniref:Ig-like domain-containing protein n=1 Tax=Candidatus Nitrosotenuis aquarius TaxID=1846278 RepID=UPI000C1E158B|nr:Ig-like domain-containing protein [Candidatus Nitrosotenuis aquarius]